MLRESNCALPMHMSMPPPVCACVQVVIRRKLSEIQELTVAINEARRHKASAAARGVVLGDDRGGCDGDVGSGRGIGSGSGSGSGSASVSVSGSRGSGAAGAGGGGGGSSVGVSAGATTAEAVADSSASASDGGLYV
jgi:hypothetical protein